MNSKLLTAEEIATVPYSRIVIRNDCPLHRHTFFEFCINLSGTYRNYINGVCHNIHTGRIIMLRPGDEHWFEADTPHVSRDIYVLPSVLKSICDCFDENLYEKLENETLAIDFSISEFQLQTLESKMSYLNTTEGKEPLKLQARHRSVIMEILDLWIDHSKNEKVDMPQWLSLLVSQLNTTQYLNKNIEQIIASTNYSHGYVCREFKKFMGKTLQDYLADSRFEFSLSLLSNNEHSVTQIAEKLGYNATSNFIIAFKNKYGMTPSQWRKEKARKVNTNVVPVDTNTKPETEESQDQDEQ